MGGGGCVGGRWGMTGPLEGTASFRMGLSAKQVWVKQVVSLGRMLGIRIEAIYLMAFDCQIAEVVVPSVR